MKRVFQCWLVVLLAFLFACGGGGGSSFLPESGGNPGIVNPPVADPLPTPVSEPDSNGKLQITSPANLAVVGGKTPISSNAEAIEGLQNIKILVDGQTISEQAFCLWDTTLVANGSHHLRIEARNASGTKLVSESIRVTVDNKVPNWTSSKSSSSLPDVRIDSISPADVNWGEPIVLEILGQGFGQLDKSKVRIDFCPANQFVYAGLSWNWFEIDSDTNIRVYLVDYYESRWLPADVLCDVVLTYHNNVDENGFWVLAKQENALLINATSLSPIITSIQPNFIPEGWSDDVVIDVYGRNFPFSSGSTEIWLTLSSQLIQTGQFVDYADLSQWFWGDSNINVLSPEHIQVVIAGNDWHEVSSGTFLFALGMVWPSSGGYFTNIARYGLRNGGEGQNPVPPSVSVSATPGGGYSPLTATLTATASSNNPGGYITSYQWDFDNDGSWDGSGQSVQYTFTLPAEVTSRTYPVKVMVTDSFDQSAAAYAYVSVEQEAVGPPPPPQGRPPIASFAMSTNSWTSPAEVVFTSTSTALDGAYLIAVEWDLNGDGQLDRTDLTPTWTYTAPDGGSVSYYPALVVWDSNYQKSERYYQEITVYGKPLPPPSNDPPRIHLGPSDVYGVSPLDQTFTVTVLESSASIASTRWFVNNQLMQNNGSQQFTHRFLGVVGAPQHYIIQVEVKDANQRSASQYATVVVAPIPSDNSGSGGGGNGSGSGGSGGQQPDLPPMEIAGGTTGGSYDVDGNIAVGQGAPNENVRLAFLAAYQRASGAAGAPVTPVQRRGSGYMQELREGAAGAGAIMMMDGQSQAAWIHGDIYHKYMSLGGPNSYLGYPLQDEAIGYASSVTGAQNAYTLCSGDGVAQASIVYHKDGPRRYNISVVRGAIFNAWKAQDYGRGALGLPILDQYQVGSDWRSDFEGGYLIYRSSQNRVDKVLNGSGGGSGGSGGGGGSNATQLIQNKLNSIPASMIGSPVAGVRTKNWGSFGTFSYREFSGGDGWIGVLVHNPNNNAVYYVRGAICKSWWDGNINGVQCDGIGFQVGLPTGDEYSIAGGQRSDFTTGYIEWNQSKDLCTFRYYSDTGPPLDSFIRELPGLIFDLFVFDRSCTQVTADNFYQCVVEYGSIVLSVNPAGRRIAVKAISEGLEKTLEASDVVKKIIKAETAPDKKIVSTITQEAARKGMGELENLRVVADRLTSSQKARLYHLAENPTLRKNLDDYLVREGGFGADMIESMVRIMPDRVADLASITIDPAAIRGILEYGGYSVNKTGLDWMVGEAIDNGRVYFGWKSGYGKRVFIHRNNALIEIAPNGGSQGSVERIIEVFNPDSWLFSGGGYSDVVRIR
jgi:hypothetical protein